jgi:DNA-binding FadR family transcriptional regulator
MPSRSEQLSAELRDAILRGDYPPGDRLPAERDLALRWGVARGTVREAVAVLLQLGLVESRRGGGGVVVRPLEDASTLVLRHLMVLDGVPNLPIIGEFLDVLELLLQAAVGLAVERATDAELAKARALLRQLVHPANGDAEYFAIFEELLQFVAATSRHLVLQLVRNSFRSVLTDDQRRAFRARLRPRGEELEPLVRSLETALDARDAASARESARLLVRIGRERILKQLETVASARPRPPKGTKP